MSVATVERLFGTWNKALEAAGFKINHSLIPITKEQVIAGLKRVAKKLGRTPKLLEFTISQGVIERLFGSWNKTLKAAGLKINHSNQPITKEQVVAELKRVAKQLGRTPMKYEFTTLSFISERPVCRMFGTWNKALKAVGLKLNRYRGFTKEQVLTEIKGLAKRLGRTPTQDDFNKRAPVSTNTVEKLFGTWNKALTTAGLTLNQFKGFTKQQIITELKRVAKKLGRTPTYDDFNKHANVSTRTVQNLFDTWNKALKAARLSLNK